MAKLIAIIRGVNPEDICPIVEVLLENGIQDIEVSLSEEEQGLACIRRASEEFNGTQLNLGVGTVINIRQVDLSLKAGAKYIIMPGWDERVVKYIMAKSIEVIPGVFSPAEVMQAVNLDIKLAKLFPADFLGAEYIKALSGPFPQIRFLAVGGVNLDTAEDMLKAGFAGLGVGSSLVPRGATKNDTGQIRINSQEYKKIADKYD